MSGFITFYKRYYTICYTNAVCWYDKNSGNFVSSAYYLKELPAWVNEFKQQELSKKYLFQEWNTVFPNGQCTESLPDDNKYETLLTGEKKSVFPYKLSESMITNKFFWIIN